MADSPSFPTDPDAQVQTQVDYLDRTYPGAHRDQLLAIVHQLPPMQEDCRIAINIPAFQEGKTIYKALTEHTVHQRLPNGQPIPAEWVEINVLLNCPRPDSAVPLDAMTRDEVQRFQQKYPQYAVHLAEKVYDFQENPLMGQIFKDLTDAVVCRNVARISSERRASLVLRSSGADIYGVNPHFLSETLGVFSNPQVIAYRSEARLPKEILERIPLLHVIQTLAVGLLRTFSRDKISNGPLSYTSSAYAVVDGFKPQMRLAEDLDLGKRLGGLARHDPAHARFHTDLRKHILHDPRRQILALLEQAGIALRYDRFGEQSQELRLRDLDTTQWASHLPKDQVPTGMQLTTDNLSREVSDYYRVYLKKTRATHREYSPHDVYEATEKLFRHLLHLLGMPRGTYDFIHTIDDLGHPTGRVEFSEVGGLESLIAVRSFPGYEVFQRSIS